MLIKLIKYDIRADYKKYAITAAALILISFVVRFADVKFGSLDDSSDWKVLFRVLVGAFITLCGSAVLLTFIFSVVRYQKKMYSDEGYLLNTIPANPVLHILSSLITEYIWLIAIAAVDVVALIISAGGLDFWRGFLTPIRYVIEIDPAFAIYLLTFMLIFPGTLMLTLIFVINFGYLFRSHRVLAGIGGYVGLMIISNILSSVVYMISGKSNFNAATMKILSDNPDYITSDESYQIVMRELAKLASGTYISTLIVNVIFFAAIFIVSSYILKKRFNID